MVKQPANIAKGMDVLAIIYVKCKADALQQFEREFFSKITSQPVFLWLTQQGEWSINAGKGCDCICPFVVATTTGHFDYIVLVSSTSSFAITHFCEDVLRGKEALCEGIKGFGPLIADTHTTIAYNNDSNLTISKQLSRFLPDYEGKTKKKKTV